MDEPAEVECPDGREQHPKHNAPAPDHDRTSTVDYGMHVSSTRRRIHRAAGD